MKICNRCKVSKNLEDFKNKNSKTCISCREIAKKSYRLKKQGKLPKYAEVQEILQKAYLKGNFVCKICNSEKPLHNFGKHKNNNKYGISRVCKECNRELNKFSKISKYGISKEEFIKKLINQNYKCEICKVDIKYLSRYNNKYKSACIDHDHETGKVRGLLCSSCNRALSLFKDNYNILQNATKYLVQYKSDKLLENP